MFLREMRLQRIKSLFKRLERKRVEKTPLYPLLLYSLE
jgi:hypothetical protein